MKPSACPCCGFPTINEPGGFEICGICNWEDDGQNDATADEVWGGANGLWSLSEARLNFIRFGAYDPAKGASVRPPKPEEVPE